jgi:hypothetical protein
MVQLGCRQYPHIVESPDINLFLAKRSLPTVDMRVDRFTPLSDIISRARSPGFSIIKGGLRRYDPLGHDGF